MTTSEDYLAHYGVKGMKWGVRRARKKQAKNEYKGQKNEAKALYRKEMHKFDSNRDRARNATDFGRASEYDYEKANSKIVKNEALAYEKYKKGLNSAKRDYRIAKGMDKQKANRKYQKANRRAEYSKQVSWDSYVEDVARTKPMVAASLAKSGHISYDDLGKANEAIRQETEMRISMLEQENRALRNQSRSAHDDFYDDFYDDF